MNELDLKKELLEKTRLIQELQQELEDTNLGILMLTIELDQAESEKLQESSETIKQLQQEIEITNQNLSKLSIELEKAEEKYRNILEHANEAIFTFYTDFRIESANHLAEQLFYYSAEDLQRMSLEHLVPQFRQLFNNKLSDPNSLNFYHNDCLFLGCRKDGHLFPIEITFGEPFQNSRKEELWIVIIRDITERKKTEQGLRLMARVFEESHDAIIITDIQGNIIDINAAFTRITGYNKNEVIGKNPNIMKSNRHYKEFYANMWHDLKTSGRWCGEIWDKRKNGEEYPKWLSISVVKDENNIPSHYVGIFSDITGKKQAEDRLKRQAHYDQLTGLPNRALFIETLQWLIEVASRENKKFALLFLDLDRFKNVNDTLGHHIGDQLLIEVAQRLKSCIRKSDIVARLAGDEFTIVINGLKRREEVVKVAKKILQTFATPVNLSGYEFFITTSIGISIFPYDAITLDNLIKHADSAMYQAKELGKNTYQFYSHELNQKVQEGLELETSLRKALNNNEFVMYYQPQIDLTNKKIVGFEALIRWLHPEKGLLPPEKFIPFAERTDLIIHIGEWVLKTACTQWVHWQQQGFPPIKIAINYSGVQLKRPNQISLISKILKTTGMNPKYLCLELTESVAMADAENTIKNLQAFKNMGISIAIDDFGTGYSSLSYLKRFPIDTLKIDKSFVKDITIDPDDNAIATTIIVMAQVLGLEVIAEGIETEEQLGLLQNWRCNQGQGYYIYRPLPLEQINDLLKNLN